MVKRGPQFGAVGERVARPPVCGVEQLDEAVVTRRDVGRHERLHHAEVMALDDGESHAALRRHRTGAHLVDTGRTGRIRDEAADELLGRLLRTLDLDEYAPGVVADVAGELEFGGQPVDVGPEPDPLDQAGHPDSESDRRHRRGHAAHAGDPLRRPSVTAASRCIRPKL